MESSPDKMDQDLGAHRSPQQSSWNNLAFAMKRPNVNKKLIPLKGLLFTFFCGFGCLWPFFTVHQKQLGLSIHETAIINMVLPFLAAICAPFLAAFVDRLGNYRRFLVFACILMGVLYTTLLFIPPVIEDVPWGRHADLHLLCAGDGSAVAMTRQGGKCAILQPPEDAAMTETEFLFITSNCTVLCTDTTSNITVDPTQMCLNNQSNYCFHVESRASLSVSVLLHTDAVQFANRPLFRNVLFSSATHCFYAIDEVVHKNESFHLLTCPSLQSKCVRICQAIETADDSVMPTGQPIFSITRHWMLTFWAYIITRALAEVLFTLSFPLTDAISITVLRQHGGGSFGRQMLFGILALGIAGPIAGVLNDAYSSYVGENSYLPSFVLFDVLMGITILLVFNIPFTIAPQPKGVVLAILRLLKDVEVLALYLAVVALGTNFGFLETFLYWFLQDLGASDFLIGVTWTVGVFPSLPFLYKSQQILDRVGHANLLAFAFIVYAVRYMGYSFIYDPWLCLPFESIEVFTFFLTRATFCTYAALLSPPSLTVTSQTMMVSLHLMIGKGIGSVAGGYFMAIFGPRIVFRGAAAFCVFCGVTYFLLYHLHIKAKRKTKHGHDPIRGMANEKHRKDRNQLVPEDYEETGLQLEEMKEMKKLKTNHVSDGHVTWSVSEVPETPSSDTVEEVTNPFIRKTEGDPFLSKMEETPFLPKTEETPFLPNSEETTFLPNMEETSFVSMPESTQPPQLEGESKVPQLAAPNGGAIQETEP